MASHDQEHRDVHACATLEAVVIFATRRRSHFIARRPDLSRPRSATFRLAAPFAPITPRAEAPTTRRRGGRVAGGDSVAGAGSARARQRRGRRVRRALIAPPREIRCTGRSRSRSARLGSRDRHGNCRGQRVRHVVRPEHSEADSALQAGDPLKRPTALGAHRDVRHRGGSETQPAAWAANRGHNRPFP